MVRDPSPLEQQPDTDTVLDALGDDTIRTLLESLDEPMSADELSEASGVPLSTTYRKLDQLEDSSLVEESVHVSPGGQHKTRYVRNFESVAVELDEENNLAMSIDRPEETITADQRLEELWSQIRRET